MKLINLLNHILKLICTSFSETIIYSILILDSRVSSHVLAILASNGMNPAGLFLESPFNNLADEITEHPFAQVCAN